MANALTHDATGSVLEWGSQELVAATGQSIVPIIDQSSFPEGTPNKYVKVVAGLFEAMSQAERDAVDAAIPQRRAQRVRYAAEVTVPTNETSPGGGWGDVIPLTTAQPLIAGTYHVACGVELGLLANSGTHVAQARLLINGTEAATWSNARSAYTRAQIFDAFVFMTGDRPTFQLQLRRLGPGAGTARARKATLVLLPAAAIVVEL